MKKYKFKKGQIVYIQNDIYLWNDYQCCIIRLRKIENSICYYQLSNIKTWRYDIKHYKEVFNKEIFDIGFRNFPRTDNWLQEDKIMKNCPEEEIPVCSQNGCEIIHSYLNATDEQIIAGDLIIMLEQIRELEKSCKAILSILPSLIFKNSLSKDL